MDNFKHWLMANSDQILVLVLGVIIVIGIIFITIYFSKKTIILRKLRKLKATSISSLQENKIAKIIGKAKPIGAPLVAPLSGRKCVYYKIVVEQKTGAKNQHWRHIIDDESHQNFMLDSYAGCAVIFMKNFDGYFVEDKVYKSGHFKDPTLKLQNYLELHSKDSLNLFGFNKTLRYREAIIEVGEAVAVMGLVKYENSVNYGIETTYSKTPVLQSQAKNKLILSDDPKSLVEKII